MSKVLVSLIAAMNNNRVIGNQGKIPWHLPEDFKMFKRTTMGKPIIMGRVTHESIGGALPGRLNIVLSRSAPTVDQQFDNQLNPFHVSNLADAITGAMVYTQLSGGNEIFIIGGGQIYAEAMPQADRIYLTRVDEEGEGDAFFPVIDLDQWRMTSCEGFAKVGARPGYQFQVWDRI